MVGKLALCGRVIFFLAARLPTQLSIYFTYPLYLYLALSQIELLSFRTFVRNLLETFPLLDIRRYNKKLSLWRYLV